MAGGKNWTDDELRAIVKDYFSMLGDEQAGQPYNKTEHRTKLMQTVERSSGSIERKHQNISAALQRMQQPWIQGYKPLGRYQMALEGAIRAHLDEIDQVIASAAPESELDVDSNVEDETVENESIPSDPKSVFVSLPSPSQVRRSGNTRPPRKTDFAAQDAANRKLGQTGEDFVMRLERARLKSAGRPDLAKKVSWESKDKGDGLGYDIVSFFEDGRRIFIEVKTTKGPITTPFFISDNEIKFAAEKGAAFRLYRLFNYGKGGRIYVVPGPLEDALKLEPVSYRARI